MSLCCDLKCKVKAVLCVFLADELQTQGKGASKQILQGENTSHLRPHQLHTAPQLFLTSRVVSEAFPMIAYFISEYPNS